MPQPTIDRHHSVRPLPTAVGGTAHQQQWLLLQPSSCYGLTFGHWWSQGRCRSLVWVLRWEGRQYMLRSYRSLLGLRQCRQCWFELLVERSELYWITGAPLYVHGQWGRLQMKAPLEGNLNLNLAFSLQNQAAQGGTFIRLSWSGSGCLLQVWVHCSTRILSWSRTPRHVHCWICLGGCLTV